jgi:hypothetical protein
MVKTCRKCGVEKAEAEFYAWGRVCRACHREAARLWTRRNRDARRRIQREYFARRAKRWPGVTGTCVCRVCGHEKPLATGFYPTSGRLCRACKKVLVAEWKRNHAKRVRLASRLSARRARRRDPERCRDYVRMWRWRRRQEKQVPKCRGASVPRNPGTQAPRNPGTQAPRHP